MGSYRADLCECRPYREYIYCNVLLCVIDEAKLDYTWAWAHLEGISPIKVRFALGDCTP